MEFWKWTDRDYTGFREFDKELKKLVDRNGLSWYPWVGSKYRSGGILVVGESNYTNQDADKDPEKAIKRVETDKWFTRRVVERLALAASPKVGTFDAIAQLLSTKCTSWKYGDCGSEIRNTWHMIAFMDICQRALWSDKKSDSPKGVRKNVTKQDFVIGWEIVRQVVEILNPQKILVVSRGACNHFISRAALKEVEVGKRIAKTCCEGKCTWMFIDHPSYWGREYSGSGAKSYSFMHWRRGVSKVLKLMQKTSDVKSPVKEKNVREKTVVTRVNGKLQRRDKMMKNDILNEEQKQIEEVKQTIIRYLAANGETDPIAYPSARGRGYHGAFHCHEQPLGVVLNLDRRPRGQIRFYFESYCPRIDGEPEFDRWFCADGRNRINAYFHDSKPSLKMEVRNPIAPSQTQRILADVIVPNVNWEVGLSKDGLGLILISYRTIRGALDYAKVFEP